jgi:hypothetical protein
VVLPTFDATAIGQSLPAFDGTSVQIQPAEDRIWLWLQQVAETHPRVRRFETLLMAADAWGTLAGNPDFSGLKMAQLPHRPQYGWQALSDAELEGTAGRARGCLAIVSIMPESVDSRYLTGFLVDEWTETIPLPGVSTGVSFEYNQPNSQAPQCLLLAVPGNFDAGPSWTAQHLAEIVRDTMDLAKVRLVDLDALPAVAGIFPALMFPISSVSPTIQPGPSPLGGGIDSALPFAAFHSGSPDAIPSSQ